MNETLGKIIDKRIDIMEGVGKEYIYESWKKNMRGPEWESHPSGSFSCTKREEIIAWEVNNT